MALYSPKGMIMSLAIPCPSGQAGMPACLRSRNALAKQGRNAGLRHAGDHFKTIINI